MTLEEAQSFFAEMGCSHFHMAREYPERYETYRALRIPTQTERAWTRAVFDALCRELVGACAPEHLWWRHSRAAALALSLDERVEMRALCLVTEKLVGCVPPRDRVMVAETLVGRAADLLESPIGRASRLDRSLASRLAQLVPAFCDADTAPEAGPPVADRKARVLARLARLTKRLSL